MRRVVVVGVLMMVSRIVLAWQWPVQDPVVAASFGQSSGSAYFRGVALTGGAQPVFPVAPGTVIYVREESDAPPVGTGTMVVVEHDRGFRSVYGHLETGTTPAAGTVVDEATRIGVMGQTGMVAQPTLQLEIIDTEAAAYVNPFALLPALNDMVAPRVSRVFAQSAGALYDLGGTTAIPAGEYVLLAECSDEWAVRSGRQGAPYAVSLYVDGQERWSVTFDSIVFVDGEARAKPGPETGHDGVYAEGGLYRLGGVVIPVGRTIVEVVAADYQGNEDSVRLAVDGLP